MKCSICSEKIKNSKSIKLFEHEICPLCMHSMSEIPVNHILYDFYKDRIKVILREKIQELI